MNLHDIYKEEGFEGLRRLAEATKGNPDPQYLRQCATGWKGKRDKPRMPSSDLAIRLIAADPRLTLDDLYRSPQSAEEKSDAA